MSKRIEPVHLWATPDSMESLDAQVTALNSPEAVHAMMLTWNYLASLVNEEEGEDEYTEYYEYNDEGGNDE